MSEPTSREAREGRDEEDVLGWLGLSQLPGPREVRREVTGAG